MSRPERYAVRFVGLVFVLAALSMLIGPTPDTNSPYLSALSSLAISTTMAQGTCPDQQCVFHFPPGPPKFACGSNTGTICDISPSGNQCTTVAC